MKGRRETEDVEGKCPTLGRRESSEDGGDEPEEPEPTAPVKTESLSLMGLCCPSPHRVGGDRAGAANARAVLVGTGHFSRRHRWVREGQVCVQMGLG